MCYKHNTLKTCIIKIIHSNIVLWTQYTPKLNCEYKTLIILGYEHNTLKNCVMNTILAKIMLWTQYARITVWWTQYTNNCVMNAILPKTVLQTQYSQNLCCEHNTIEKLCVENNILKNYVLNTIYYELY